MQVDCYSKVTSLMGPIEEGGDLAIIRETETMCFIGLIDALGHGAEANSAAMLAGDYLKSNFQPDLDTLISELHTLLKNSRGCVLALCCFDKKSGELSFSGIGNITVRILRADAVKMLSRDGVIGYNIPNPRGQSIKMYSGDVLVMSSDGLSERMDALDFPGLLLEDAESIGTGLFERYEKGSDDASIVIMKVAQ